MIIKNTQTILRAFCFLCFSSRGERGAVRRVAGEIRRQLCEQGRGRGRLGLPQVRRLHQRADGALQEPGEEPTSHRDE